jgi:hypothetical protein
MSTLIGMSDPLGLNLLIQKYAELAGKLECLDMEARAIKASMSHLDASIRLIKHGYDTTAIRPKHPYNRNPYFKRGSYVRVALDVLREAKEPLPAREICELALQKQGLQGPNKSIVDGMVRAMETCLMKKTKEGVIEVHRGFFPKRFSIQNP